MNSVVNKFSQLSLLLLTASIIHKQQSDHNELASRKTWDHQYDFIVIGSGSAGSIVASRLSEESNFKVLLLEAGGAADVITDMPAKEKTLKGGIFDWGFFTSPQKYGSFGYKNNQVPHERGKVLGGTSVVNNMNYLRGLPQDFENWAHHVQDDQWSWHSVLAYFLKAENNSDPRMMANGLHNNRGTVNFISPPRNLLIDTFINATHELGYPDIVDLNGPHFGEGAAYLQKNILKGIRVSTSAGYLKPIHKTKKNIHILAEAYVVQILFDSNKVKPRAIGVKFCKDNGVHTVYARKEIILSAGSFNSAKLLLLSGIGPKKDLQKLGIPIVVNSPVGQNYYESICLFDGLHFTTNRNFTLKEFFDYDDLINYFIHGSGPLTINTHAGLRHKDSYGRVSQIRFVGGSKCDDYSYGEQTEKTENLKREIWKKYYGPYFGKCTISAWAILHHPKSRGYVKLKSTNPFDMPIINPNFLSDPSDIDSLIDLVYIVYDLIHTKSFQNLNAKPFATIVPGCEQYYIKQPVPPKEYLKCIIRVFINHCSDPIATCKMGSHNAKDAVVDSRLRVFGVDGLRVADSSIIPVTFSGHTHTVATMIGEKAADLIKKDWHAKKYINDKTNHVHQKIHHMENKWKQVFIRK